MKTLRAIAIVFLVVAMASGCGFQLRGTDTLPEQLMQARIDAVDPFSPLLRELRPRLQAAGVDLDQPDQPARIVINQDELRTEVLSVGAQARVREFELVYQLRFRVLDAEGDVLLANQQLELRREFSFDETQLLGKAREEEFLRDELYRQMAELIMVRLSAISP